MEEEENKKIKRNKKGYNRVRVEGVEIESETEDLAECLNAVMWLLNQDCVKTKMIEFKGKGSYLG